ncbi:hypothetical protein Droror1_Dr00009961 [Drosera rotundifolia]
MEGKQLRAILFVRLVTAALVDGSSASIFGKLGCYFNCVRLFHDTTQLMASIALCTNPPPPLPPMAPDAPMAPMGAVHPSVNSCTKDCSKSSYWMLGSEPIKDATVKV